MLRAKHIPIADRYDQFRGEIKWLGGPASTTEMLCYIQPQDCGIWNRRARDALRLLKLDKFVNPDKYQISPDEYLTFNEILKAIFRELKTEQIENVDLLFVDLFLYTMNIEPEQPPEKGASKTFDHDEIRDAIQRIGEMLGFDTNIEVPVAQGAIVDAVWRASIGNLGMVTYVFEVHRSGSIDSLLLNLQRARSNPTVQKVIAVSDDTQIERIKNESKGLPSDFLRALTFWNVSEVQEVSEKIESAMQIVGRLDLVHNTF